MGVDYGSRKKAKKRRKQLGAEGVPAEGNIKARKQRRGVRRLCQGMCFQEPSLTAEDKDWGASDDEDDRVMDMGGFEHGLPNGIPSAKAVKKRKHFADTQGGEPAGQRDSPRKQRKLKHKDIGTPNAPKFSTGTNLLHPAAAAAPKPGAFPDSDPNSFNSFPVLIQRFAAAQKLPEPTPIQRQCWPLLCDGKDVQGIAPPGSGKTLAYLLPAAIILQEAGHSGSNTPDAPLVLILTPTRELAIQVAGECRGLKRLGGWCHACLYGGVPKEPQVEALTQPPHILVATPGRLLDLLDSGALKLDKVLYVVLDEADKMLSLGFKPQLDRLRDCLRLKESKGGAQGPAGNKKKKKKAVESDDGRSRPQVVLFTATMPAEVELVAQQWSHPSSSCKVHTEQHTLVSPSITQVVHVCAEHKKPDKLLKHLGAIRDAAVQADMRNLPRVLIFANKVKTVRFIHELVQQEGYRAVMVHGERLQAERSEAIVQFRSGKAQVLVATDVAGRGLDIRNLPYVVNYDFPPSLDSYVHRIGRTGRLAAKGHSYSFFTRNLANLAPPVVQLLTQHHQAVDPNLVALAEAWKVAAEKLGIDPLRPNVKTLKDGQEENDREDDAHDANEEADLDEMAPDRLEGLPERSQLMGQKKAWHNHEEMDAEGTFSMPEDKFQGHSAVENVNASSGNASNRFPVGREAEQLGKKKRKAEEQGEDDTGVGSCPAGGGRAALDPIVSMVEKMLERKMQRAAARKLQAAAGQGCGTLGANGQRPEPESEKGKGKQDSSKGTGNIKGDWVGMGITAGAKFIPSKRFEGATQGYVFKKGNQGLGYYIDCPPVVNKKKLAVRSGPVLGLTGMKTKRAFGKEKHPELTTGRLFSVRSIDSDNDSWGGREQARGINPGKGSSSDDEEGVSQGMRFGFMQKQDTGVLQHGGGSRKGKKSLPGRLRKKLAKVKDSRK